METFGRMARVQGGEKRRDSDKPFGGAQKRFAEALEKVGDERLARETERVVREPVRRGAKRKRRRQARAVEIVQRMPRQAGRRSQEERYREAREEFRRQLARDIAFRR